MVQHTDVCTQCSVMITMEHAVAEGSESKIFEFSCQPSAALVYLFSFKLIADSDYSFGMKQ
jgi:hypothetical protein